MYITPINKTYGDLRWDLTYTNDPRLKDVMRGQYNDVSRPPLTAQVREDEIYDGNVVNSNWKRYSSYKDVDHGQIMYYYRGDSRSPYNREIMDAGEYDMVEFIDPNGTQKFYYPFVDCVQSCNKYMNDSQYHREDLISKQMGLMNRHKYVVLPR
jgi:hypothetical protein